jgi:hypothetical protein
MRVLKMSNTPLKLIILGTKKEGTHLIDIAPLLIANPLQNPHFDQVKKSELMKERVCSK